MGPSLLPPSPFTACCINVTTHAGPRLTTTTTRHTREDTPDTWHATKSETPTYHDKSRMNPNCAACLPMHHSAKHIYDHLTMRTHRATRAIHPKHPSNARRKKKKTIRLFFAVGWGTEHKTGEMRILPSSTTNTITHACMPAHTGAWSPPGWSHQYRSAFAASTVHTHTHTNLARKTGQQKLRCCSQKTRKGTIQPTEILLYTCSFQRRKKKEDARGINLVSTTNCSKQCKNKKHLASAAETINERTQPNPTTPNQTACDTNVRRAPTATTRPTKQTIGPHNKWTKIKKGHSPFKIYKYIYIYFPSTNILLKYYRLYFSRTYMYPVGIFLPHVNYCREGTSHILLVHIIPEANKTMNTQHKKKTPSRKRGGGGGRQYEKSSSRLG